MHGVANLELCRLKLSLGLGRERLRRHVGVLVRQLDQTIAVLQFCHDMSLCEVNGTLLG